MLQVEEGFYARPYWSAPQVCLLIAS
jgi:hypothetical protein